MPSRCDRRVCCGQHLARRFRARQFYRSDLWCDFTLEMSVDHEVERRQRTEKLSLRIVGVCFLTLAIYVVYESAMDLWARQALERSIAGITLACVSLIAMPILSRAKKKVGRQLRSAAMNADARQTDFCVYLSAILLAGLALNAILGWW